LPLGVDGVERQRRLARTTRPGDHHQLVAGKLAADVLQVVLGRSPDYEPFSVQDSGFTTQNPSGAAGPAPTVPRLLLCPGASIRFAGVELACVTTNRRRLGPPASAAPGRPARASFVRRRSQSAVTPAR